MEAVPQSTPDLNDPAAMDALVESIVTYHAPDAAGIAAITAIRMSAKVMILAILHNCPRNPDRTAAIRKVREAMMTANAAIVVPPLPAGI